MFGTELNGKSVPCDTNAARRDIGRRKAAPCGWTPNFVGKELVEAIRWAETRTVRSDPTSRETLFPGIALASDELSIEGWPPIKQHGISSTLAGASSSSRVSQFERILRWPASYLQDQSREAHALHVWTRSKVRRFAKLDDACRYLGWSRPTAYRALDRALTAIAMGLTADNIERGEH